MKISYGAATIMVRSDATSSFGVILIPTPTPSQKPIFAPSETRYSSALKDTLRAVIWVRNIRFSHLSSALSASIMADIAENSVDYGG